MTDQTVDLNAVRMGSKIEIHRGATELILKDGEEVIRRSSIPYSAATFELDPIVGAIDFFASDGQQVFAG